MIFNKKIVVLKDFKHEKKNIKIQLDLIFFLNFLFTYLSCSKR